MNIHRLLNGISADIKFQLKQGFYTVYAVLSLIYIIILSFIPEAPLKIVLPVLIYTDPAGLGLFFIGGIVLLEKEQGILSLLYITPLKVKEYITSKILTLGVISALTALIISAASFGKNANYFYLLSGTFLSSVFYTLAGFILASRAKSVNDYIVKMIPAIILVILPCITLIPNSLVPDVISKLMLIIPSAGGLKLIFGGYADISPLDTILSFLGLAVCNVLLIKKVSKILTDNSILI